MASSRGLKPGIDLSRSKRSCGQHARRSCFHGTQPGTTLPEMRGGGNMPGKFSEVTRMSLPDAMDQMVSHCTSCEVKNLMCRLSCDSMRKKSNTPCCPGFLPVTSEVHAGGVSGGTIVRR